MSRRLLGYRVGIIKPDGARRYMKPRSDGKWSLSEAKPMLLTEDEMSDALDDVGDFMKGGDVSFSTPVFAVRKPKPAPCPCPSGTCPTCMGADDEPKPAPVAPVAPVVAAEGLFGCLHVDDSGIAFEALWKGHGDTVRDAGTREESVAAVEKWGGKLVRILDDGEHEAALAAARREERERVFALVTKRLHAERNSLRGVGRTTMDNAIYAVTEEAAKGQAK